MVAVVGARGPGVAQGRREGGGGRRGGWGGRAGGHAAPAAVAAQMVLIGIGQGLACADDGDICSLQPRTADDAHRAGVAKTPPAVQLAQQVGAGEQ